MVPTHRTPTHPGEILRTEFLEPLGISRVALAAQLGLPTEWVDEFVRGEPGVTLDTAWVLGEVFGTSPEFWMR